MSEQEFGAQLITLPSIFEAKLFTIPDYQRGYAWDKDQVEDLLKDIDHLISDGIVMRHYTGTLVLGRPGTGGVENEFHVVDGQQRLTTLVILLRLIGSRLPNEEQDVFNALYIRRGEYGSDRNVLRLNSDTRLFFERVVLGDGDHSNEPMTLESHERLMNARSLIDSWIEKSIASGISIKKIREAVENELGFIVYAPKEDSETGIMFEVINNRGKPLSELEKVKNFLIYCCVKLSATGLRDSINTDWSVIIKRLNKAKKTTSADEGAFLRYCVAVHFQLNKTDSQYGYDELKKRIAIDLAIKNPAAKNETLQKIENFVSFMNKSSLWYERLYGQQHDGLETDIRMVLDLIRAQERHASIMPLFLSIAIKLNENKKQQLSLLKLLEVLNFRVYMARNMTRRNDTGQGELYYLASQYYHNKLLKAFSEDGQIKPMTGISSEEDALEYRLVEFITKNSPDSLFKSSFNLEVDSPDDFYKWGGLRYFLMNYEIELQPNKTIQIDKISLSRSEGKSADYLSVEHLWAVENRNNPGENDRKIDRFEKRRLGNFVLLELRLNIQGQHDAIAEKIPRYLKGFDGEPPTDLEQVRKMARDAKEILKKKADWTRSKNYYLEIYSELNTQQENRYMAFAEKRWSIRDRPAYQIIQSISMDS